MSYTLSRELMITFLIFSTISTSHTSYPNSSCKWSYKSYRFHMLPSISWVLLTFLAFLTTELFDKCAYRFVRLSKSKSHPANLTYGSAYIQTVRGFQSVTITHYLRSNLRHFARRLVSMYFWTIYCVSICLQTSRISTSCLNKHIPLPLLLPAGLTIQMFFSPSIPN